MPSVPSKIATTQPGKQTYTTKWIKLKEKKTIRSESFTEENCGSDGLGILYKYSSSPAPVRQTALSMLPHPCTCYLMQGKTTRSAMQGTLTYPSKISLLVVFIAESEGQEAEEFYCSHLSRISYVVMTVVSPGKCHDCSAS